jgi:hypothetical protein
MEPGKNIAFCYYVEKSKAEKLSNSVRILKKNQADSML